MAHTKVSYAIWLNGDPVDPKNTSEGVQFAYGLFETLRFDAGRLEQPDAHLTRLNDGLRVLGLHHVLTRESLFPMFSQVCHAEALTSGVLKILVLRRGHDVANAEIDVQLLFRANPYLEADNAPDQKPYTLGMSPFRKNHRSPMKGLKWIGYADHVIEKERAAMRGFQDVLFLNDLEFVAETAVANIFWIKEGVLFTPSVDCGILPGVMRANVLAAAREMKLPAREGVYCLEAMLGSEFIFATNSLMRFMRVTGIEEKTWEKPSADALKIFEQLKGRVLKIVRPRI
jgi:4-amino-4-deoxychorismate lyase